MSYILEALKKSEQLRGQGTVAARISLQPVTIEELGPQQRWPHYGLAAIVLAGASASFLWLHRAPPPVSGVSEIPRRTQAAPPPLSIPALVEAHSQERALTMKAPAARPTAKEPTEDASVARIAPVIEPARPPAAMPVPGKQTLTVAELPAGVQRALPPLSVAGFVHVDGAGGMVMVDDKLVREGEEVAPGLTLEKILADSVIFSYKGYRFKR